MTPINSTQIQVDDYILCYQPHSRSIIYSQCMRNDQEDSDSESDRIFVRDFIWTSKKEHAHFKLVTDLDQQLAPNNEEYYLLDKDEVLEYILIHNL